MLRIALFFLMCVSGVSFSAVNKCVDDSGRVVYTSSSCGNLAQQGLDLPKVSYSGKSDIGASSLKAIGNSRSVSGELSTQDDNEERLKKKKDCATAVKKLKDVIDAVKARCVALRNVSCSGSAERLEARRIDDAQFQLAGMKNRRSVNTVQGNVVTLAKQGKQEACGRK